MECRLSLIDNYPFANVNFMDIIHTKYLVFSVVRHRVFGNSAAFGQNNSVAAFGSVEYQFSEFKIL